LTDIIVLSFCDIRLSRSCFVTFNIALQKAIREAYRVLKKGGRMMVMEFSHVTNPLMAQAYDQFSFHAIPAMGKIIANDAASYQYLVESIRRFPKQVSFYCPIGSLA